MVRRNKKSLHQAADYAMSFHTKPSLYKIIIFHTPTISKNSFIPALTECLNCNEDKATSLYFKLTSNNHIEYGQYTKDVAETIAFRVKALTENKACCVLKDTNDIK